MFFGGQKHVSGIKEKKEGRIEEGGVSSQGTDFQYKRRRATERENKKN